jgi:signal transduction histidine kinase
MKNKELLITKKRLTIIFTLLVFLIAIFLEWIFFTTKYIKSIKSEKHELILISTLIQDRFNNLNEFVNGFNFWKKFFEWRKIKIIWNKELDNSLFINLLIIDKNSNEIVFSNINENINEDLIEISFFDLEYKKLIQKYWFLVEKFNINNNIIPLNEFNYDFILYKKLWYSFEDYINDLLYFILFTLLFSIIFYYIWYKFVSKNLEPVEKSLKDMQDFIHNAWHELKTPLSVIYWNLQLLNELKKYDKKLTNEWIKEIDRLNKLIDWLLELSNIGITNGRQNINIKNEIEKIINEYTIKLSKKDIKLSFEANYELIININKEYFYILFSNLLWNAIKFTNKWWEIKIILDKNTLKIIDNWIWIKEEYIKNIFDRFYQVEGVRNSEGFWIGLSLVKKILDIYKWKINVKSIKDKWTTFEIKF